MKISVVTAVYNRSQTVAETMRSVQAQDYVNIEHIVQDGGSTDGTLDILRDCSDERTFFKSDTDSGLYDAINRGIARSSGDVVGLMHSDDVFASTDVLSAVSNAFDSPLVDGVYGDLHYVSATDPNRLVRHWSAGVYHVSRLRYGWMPPHPTLYLRRHIFEEYGSYDTSFRIAADYDATLRWLIKGGIRLAYIPKVFVKMRLGGASNASFKNILQKSREDYRAIRRNHAGGLGTLVCKNLRKTSQFL